MNPFEEASTMKPLLHAMWHRLARQPDEGEDVLEEYAASLQRRLYESEEVVWERWCRASALLCRLTVADSVDDN